MKKEKKEVEKKTSKLAIASFISSVIRSKLEMIIILLIIIGLIIFFYPKPSQYVCGAEAIGCDCIGIEIEYISGKTSAGCPIFYYCYGLPVHCEITGRLVED